MKIKGLFQKIVTHSLARDSAIVFAGSMVSNVAAYLYHLLMGRMLGPEGYGELSSLLSIFYIFTVPLSVGQLVLVKFISAFKAHGELGQTKTLILKVTKGAIVVCISLFPIMVIISPIIASYLRIQSPYMFIIVYLIFIFSLLTVIVASVLQGYQKFIWITLLGSGAIIAKIIFSIPAVQFGVMGILVAIFASGVLMFILNFLPLRFLLKVSQLPIKLTKWETIKFAVPTLFVILGMTSIYTTDIILVRHYFSSVNAGIYASLAVLGKIIFYASSVLGTVFYPVLSERTAKSEKTGQLTGIGLLFVALISIAINLIYFLFPDFIIKMLFGTSYVGGKEFLGIFGIFMVLYSIGGMFTTIFLATGKTKIWIIPILCALFQIIGISLFHQSILMVIYINIAISTLLVACLGGYYLRSRTSII